MKKLLLAAALLMGMTKAAYAQYNINVLMLDGKAHTYVMEQVDKIEVSQGAINMVKKSGDSESIDMAKIDKIEFNKVETAIHPTAGSTGKVTVKSTGYAFEVSGLANGGEVCVYTQSGMLMGKAVAKGGKAKIDAAGYPSGVYVIKAGGRSMKMIKK